MEEMEYQDVEFLEIEDEVPQIKQQKVYRCSICPNFTTDKVVNMKKHLLIHENGKRPCKICGKNFFHTRMIYHLSTEHRDIKDSQKILKDFMETERKICPMCNKRFPLDALEIHFQAGNCCNVDNMNVPKLRKAEVYKCEICPSIFVNYRNYNRHEKVHEKGTVQCLHCQNYLLECDMKYHLHHVHPDIKEYENKECKKDIQFDLKCKFCSKSFNKSFVHKRHENFHEAGKEFCKPCEKFYSAKDYQWHTENMHPKSNTDKNENLPEDIEHKFEDPNSSIIDIVEEQTIIQPDIGSEKELTDDADENVEELTDDADENVDPVSVQKNFKCQFCSKGFARRSTLKRHEMIHNSGKVYCQVCDRFMTKSEMDIHKLKGQHLAPKKTMPCKYCSKGFSRNFVCKRHEKEHEMGRHYCKDCNKFYSPEDMDWHMTHVHSEGRKPAFVQCPKCPKLFTKMEYCLSHQKTHEEQEKMEQEKMEKDFPVNSSIAPAPKNVESPVKRTVNPTEFQKIFESQFLNIETEQTETMIDEEIEEERLEDESEEETEEEEVEEEEFELENPSKESKFTEKRYKCQICPIQFESRFELLRHIKRVHEISQKEPCPICGRNYKTNKIAEHLAKVHNHILDLESSQNDPNKYFYKCDHCPKTFMRQYTRNRHQQLHENGRKPCPHCKKLFNEDRFDLHTIKCKYHDMVKETTAKEPTELEQRTCPICSLVVSQKKDLPRHMMVHTKIICKLCERPVLEMSLDEHMRKKHLENIEIE